MILASGSPRRRELLSNIGHEFRVIPAQGLERRATPGEQPARYAAQLARQKCAEVALLYPHDIVIGADTVVTIDGLILGKPEDEAAALDMLLRLNARRHEVITAVAVSRHGREVVRTETTSVTMKSSSTAELHNYVQSGESMDKAGAYAVQGLGGTLVSGYIGCYNNIVGLPLCVTADVLAEFGIDFKAEADRIRHVGV